MGFQAADNAAVPGGAVTTSLKGGQYAVFPLKAGELRSTMDRIYTDWLPGSGYDLAQLPVIERYGPDWQSAEEKMMEIWLPLKDAEI